MQIGYNLKVWGNSNVVLVLFQHNGRLYFNKGVIIYLMRIDNLWKDYVTIVLLSARDETFGFSVLICITGRIYKAWKPFE